MSSFRLDMYVDSASFSMIFNACRFTGFTPVAYLNLLRTWVNLWVNFCAVSELFCFVLCNFARLWLTIVGVNTLVRNVLYKSSKVLIFWTLLSTFSIIFSFNMMYSSPSLSSHLDLA